MTDKKTLILENKHLIIGNKPYGSLLLDKFLDLFVENTRCNMGMPKNNNGTICDELALCNHIYDRMVPQKVPLSSFVEMYQDKYKMEYIEKFYKDFDTWNFNRVYYAHANTLNYNEMLSSWGCPYSFSALPRTGLVAIFEKILREFIPVVFGFSINSETRKTFYVYDSIFDLEDNNKSCHSKDDEIKIIRWLHENNKADITPCMLQDSEVPTIKCEGLKPSRNIIDLLRYVYREVRIQH
tara:strand:- start:6363 stop:7079 length:717 start_codon:yes stop_codon:yes gene_type:complete